MKIIFSALLFLFSFNLYAQDITYPQNTSIEDISDSELKSLVWNRYVNENFVILSIDEKQGLWLSKNINLINNWCTNRWGFSKVSYSKECRIFCVPNNSLLKKLFGLDSSKVEVRKKEGEIEISVMWLVLDDPIPPSVAPYLTRASFAELEEQEGIVLPWWFLRSSEILNSPVKNIKNLLDNALDIDPSTLDCKSIFETKAEDYQSFTKEEKDVFDQKCLTLCLFLRKEFGEVKLLGLLRLEEKNDVENVLRVVYGYKNMKEFESKFQLYVKDFAKSLMAERVPDSYLEVTSRGVK